MFKVKSQITGIFLAAKSFCTKNLSKVHRQLLANEIRIMRKLSHKNILRIHEVHETLDTVYVILDLMTDGDLSGLMTTVNLSENRIKKLMYQIIQGLAHIEQHGMIHRDIKPTNIMLGRESLPVPTVSNPQATPSLSDASIFPVIGDFGLACYKDESILAMGSGTHGYMPPEVVISKTLSGVQYTPKVDVFSAGVIFYKMVVKKDPVPFRPEPDASVSDIMKKYQINYNSRLIREFNPDGIDLMKKMLALEPKHRILASVALTHPFFASEAAAAKTA